MFIAAPREGEGCMVEDFGWKVIVVRLAAMSSRKRM
jgi:hypothetical protein